MGKQIGQSVNSATRTSMGGYGEAEVDFIADNPGLTLFHCHQQLHMDYGFRTLFDYVWAPEQ
jgi:FtsP/CotA-like multicopper oxidase with cupredoxin domain